MIKVLILGSTGMLGHKVFHFLDNNSDFTLFNISYKNKLNSNSILVDANNKEHLIEVIKSIKPNFIVNCIGLLIQDSIERPDQAIYLNSYLPHMLELVASKINSKLIHISTDCVFSGIKKSPYAEDDIKDAKDIYGTSKSLGEPLGINTLTIRTSIIGPELKKDGFGLFNWFMCQSGNITGYKKMIWSGVTTLELSKAIKWAINKDISGIYHITNNKKICKNDLINLFKVHTGRNIKITPVSGKDIDKSFIDTRKLINHHIPSYNRMVKEMIDDINKSKNIYKHYKFY